MWQTVGMIVRRYVTAHNQASRVRLQPFKYERPSRQIPAARGSPRENEAMLGLILHDRKHVGYSRERGEYTARLDVLKLRQDAIRTAVAAVIDEVVSVPPSSAGPHLDKPGPDVMRRATNGDRVIDRADGLGNQAVSGKSLGLLARSRADLHAAVRRKRREDYQSSGEPNQYFPFHSHANRKGSPVELSPHDCDCAGVFGENAEADLPGQTAGVSAVIVLCL